MTASPIGGYVLAGGRSSRMGTDKAELKLAGEPLIAHAVAKLRSFCAEVHILSVNPALAAYAPLVGDLHPGCGPLGGLQAALHHSPFAWNIFLPVDMPLLPAAFIRACKDRWSNHGGPARIWMLAVGGIPQPGFCFLHQDVLPWLTESIRRGEYKLMSAFDLAAIGLARQRGTLPEALLRRDHVKPDNRSHALPTPFPPGSMTAEAPLIAPSWWFANLNTPQDFAEAGTHMGQLDHGAGDR